MDSWTDQSRDPKDWWDSFVPNKIKRAHATNDRVVELSRALHKLDVNNPKAVEEFDNKWFDIDTFFKAMVWFKAYIMRVIFNSHCPKS